VKGATPPGLSIRRRCSDFNPRTREGCDVWQGMIDGTLTISIHAPVKGATILYPYHYARQDISIHAPVKGATPVRLAPTYPTGNFNPRTREGCDLFRGRCYRPAQDFNPRTREGCDFTRRWTVRRPGDFNPRTREGCDSKKCATISALNYFNPRTREGCD